MKNYIAKINISKKSQILSFTKKIEALDIPLGMLYCDPPWNPGMITYFNNKIEKNKIGTWNALERLYKAINHFLNHFQINGFIEYGKSTKQFLIKTMQKLNTPKHDIISVEGKFSGNKIWYGGFSKIHKTPPSVRSNRAIKTCILSEKVPKSKYICDLFMGTGSTMKAANQLGYNFIGCDYNEKKLDLVLKKKNCYELEIES